MTKELKGVFEQLKKELGEKDDRYLYLDFAGLYGGYKLVYVIKENGGHSTPFENARMSSKVMIIYIRGILKGLELRA